MQLLVFGYDIFFFFSEIIVGHNKEHTRIYDKHLCICMQHCIEIYSLNPILTGGGGFNFDPPPVRNPRLPRDRRRSRHAFPRLFSFTSCASFDTKFAKIGPSVARSHDVLYVLYYKICPKSAFCICLCTKHMEITDFLKML